jgi:hypothetical protein
MQRLFLCMNLQNLKNQIMTTNLWVEQVSFDIFRATQLLPSLCVQQSTNSPTRKIETNTDHGLIHVSP